MIEKELIEAWAVAIVAALIGVLSYFATPAAIIVGAIVGIILVVITIIVGLGSLFERLQ